MHILECDLRCYLSARFILAGDMTIDEENKLKKRVVKGNWGIAKDKAAQQVSLEKVQSYEEAFERIKEATGITEIDDLVSTFIEAEENNFSLFTYVRSHSVSQVSLRRDYESFSSLWCVRWRPWCR